MLLLLSPYVAHFIEGHLFVHLVLQKVAAGIMNKVAALTKLNPWKIHLDFRGVATITGCSYYCNGCSVGFYCIMNGFRHKTEGPMHATSYIVCKI